MLQRFIANVLLGLLAATLFLSGCQPIQPEGSATWSDARIEQLKAEAVQHELGTFDLYINRDWETLDTETAPEYYGIATDGSYTERDAMMAGLQDEKLTVRKPDLGEIRVLMITPDAYMVTYPLNFNGSYDGNDFSNPRTVASLWVRRQGKWQNIFLTDIERTVPVEGLAGSNTESLLQSVSLPNGFQPEGIAIGRDTTAYVSSIGSGAIYKVDLRTGEGSIFVPAQEGHGSLGLAYDPRTDYLYVAAHTSGKAQVFDGMTGELVQEFQLTTDPKGLVNDVALSNNAVFFTDSQLPVFYRVPLSESGELPTPMEFETISLTGEFEYLPEGINGNGIVASDDGKKVIIATTDLGKLYTVDATTGEAMLLTLDAETELYHDGMVRVGDMLYVINYNDRVYVVQLDAEWASGTLLRTITDPNFEAIATAASYGNSLFVVNARWDAEQTPDTEFWVTQVAR